MAGYNDHRHPIPRVGIVYRCPQCLFITVDALRPNSGTTYNLPFRCKGQSIMSMPDELHAYPWYMFPWHDETVMDIIYCGPMEML